MNKRLTLAILQQCPRLGNELVSYKFWQYSLCRLEWSDSMLPTLRLTRRNVKCLYTDKIHSSLALIFPYMVIKNTTIWLLKYFTTRLWPPSTTTDSVKLVTARNTFATWRVYVVTQLGRKTKTKKRKKEKKSTRPRFLRKNPFFPSLGLLLFLLFNLSSWRWLWAGSGPLLSWWTLLRGWPASGPRTPALVSASRGPTSGTRSPAPSRRTPAAGWWPSGTWRRRRTGLVILQRLKGDQNDRRSSETEITYFPPWHGERGQYS